MGSGGVGSGEVGWDGAKLDLGRPSLVGSEQVGSGGWGWFWSSQVWSGARQVGLGQLKMSHQSEIVHSLIFKYFGLTLMNGFAKGLKEVSLPTPWHKMIEKF